MTDSRLQKLIAQAGIASRRKAEEIITEGRVRVNGKVVTELGFKADPKHDRIEVDGKPLEGEAVITVLMNKPRGVVCTVTDPEGRPTVMDFVKNINVRVFPVGRLDFATSGALLLTNDGALSFALTHPKHKVEKIYLVKVEGAVKETTLQQWRDGVDIGDGVTQPAEVFKAEEDENFTWIHVTLREGRNRQIRRMAEATGLTVKKLKRISFAGLTIDRIRVGEYRVLSALEIRKLKEKYNIPSAGPRIPGPLKPAQKEPRAAKTTRTDRRRPVLDALEKTSPKARPRAPKSASPSTETKRKNFRHNSSKKG